MPDEPAFGTFFLPGPTEVRHEVLAAMTGPMIGHRGAAFEALYARVHTGLQQVFRTSRPVYVSTSSATGFMEAGVRNAPPGPILAVVNGAFSERFADIARGCGREVAELEVPWGDVVEAEAVAAQLAVRPFSAVTVVHSETSTGALTDIRAVSAAVRAHGALCLVDSVTGLAGAPIETESWELDFLLTGSQKALAIPPGLAFASVSERYLAGVTRAEARGRYFDILEFERYAAKQQTPNTPAISLLYALDVQLAAIAREGVEARWARHAAMAARTHAWVEEAAAATGIALGILAPVGARSPTVTAVTLPNGITGTEVVRAVAARGFVIGDGYGQVKDRTFRIGHMGDHSVEGLERCLAACGDALDALARGHT